MAPFLPPFCPNPACPRHRAGSPQPYREYIAWGSYPTKAFGAVPRFRCLSCRRTFSAQTFSPHYYAKLRLDIADIATRLVSTSGLRAIGRALGASSDTVSNRVARAARQVLAAESRLSLSRRPCEDLAADGFESFCVSQYFPNNIHVLVGSRSQFVYAANHVTIRRKGRMTEGQRARRAELEARFRAAPRGIEDGFAALARDCLRVLCDGARPRLELWTDEKQEYARALARPSCAASLAASGRLAHRTVSSRRARTTANPLFAVNYIDRELRKDLHEHVRETACFGRNVNRQMERLAVWAFMHNYLKPHRVRGSVSSHAEVAGYDPGEIARELGVLWTERAMLSRVDLDEGMLDTWLRRRATPLKAGSEYLPAYAA
jgi:transposase-like protein